MKIWSILYFYSLWIFIGAVSSLDIYLTIRFSENLPDGELNPIARLILHNDDWDVSRFVAIKSFMTILVLGILMAFHKYHRRFGDIIIKYVALAQLCLLVFLLYYWYY